MLNGLPPTESKLSRSACRALARDDPSPSQASRTTSSANRVDWIGSSGPTACDWAASRRISEMCDCPKKSSAVFVRKAPAYWPHDDKTNQHRGKIDPRPERSILYRITVKGQPDSLK